MIVYIYFILGAFFNALAAYLIKISFHNGQSIFDIILKGPSKELGLMLLALTSFFSAFIFYGLVLSKTNLNIAQPVFNALSMLFVIVISILLLNEPFSFKYFIGIVLVIIGIFFLSQS